MFKLNSIVKPLIKIKLKIQELWYLPKIHFLLWPLIPFSFLYLFIIVIRKLLYDFNLFGFKKKKFSIPVIVIGNLTVGGSGKTPLVIHIARLLKQHGMKPGVISRGYKGNFIKPTFVYANSDPTVVGDEPLLMAKRLFCPIVVAKHRNDAIATLINSNQVDVILSDDGLQHSSMIPNIEIVVVDGKRRFGNGWYLPAGPLREPISRLYKVDFIISNTPLRFDKDGEYEMELRPRLLYKGIRPSEQLGLASFKNQTVHAIAGIGFPERFFDLLRQYELIPIQHPYPDHYLFTKEDIQFQDNYPIIMTEKDAVKCEGKMNENHWILPVEASINPLFDVKLLTKLEGLRRG